MKLRTVSASYTLPESIAEMVWASRVAVTASVDNLWTIWQKSKDSFGHPIMDIERARQSPGQFGLNGYVQEGWPQLTRFVSTFRSHSRSQRDENESKKQTGGCGPVRGFIPRVLRV